MSVAILEMQIKTTSLQSEWLPSRKQQKILASMWRKSNYMTLLVGVQPIPSTMEIHTEVPKKIKNGTSICSSHNNSGHIWQRTNSVSYDIHIQGALVRGNPSGITKSTDAEVSYKVCERR
jgi:hypothetical protein